MPYFHCGAHVVPRVYISSALLQATSNPSLLILIEKGNEAHSLNETRRDVRRVCRPGRRRRRLACPLFFCKSN